jgi:hypothetical protein
MKNADTTNKRQHYLDWLRILAFGLLFLFHSWRPFDSLPWHIKNEGQHAIFDLLTMFTHGWRMHLIFLVSGAGTWFALRSRQGRFVIDRLKRLIVPFLFGIAVLIPPQRYYEWKMFHAFEGSFLEFITLYPGQIFNVNMGPSIMMWFGHLGTHLWYLPYLFVMTMLFIPLFKRIQEGKIDLTWLKKIISTPFGIFVLVIPMLIMRLIFKPIFQAYTDWADFLVYIWPFIYGYIFMMDKEFIEIVKLRMYLLLNVAVISSIIFIYMGSTNEQMVQIYTYPEYSWAHVSSSIIAMFIAVSWVLFFLALFARKMNFNHKIIVPANTSILPIYLLHQTLIIVFGYYIVLWDINLFIKFIAIALTSIPTSILIYRIIQTCNPLRFLFGLKPLKPKERAISPVHQVV